VFNLFVSSIQSVVQTMVQTIWLNKIIFYLAVIAGCIIAFAPAQAGLQPQLNDKLLHCTGFFIMGLLSHLAHPRANQYLLIFALTLLGSSIEVVQAYLPYRTFSLWDMLADVGGIIAYFLIFSHFVKGKFLPD